MLSVAVAALARKVTVRSPSLAAATMSPPVSETVTFTVSAAVVLPARLSVKTADVPSVTGDAPVDRDGRQGIGGAGPGRGRVAVAGGILRRIGRTSTVTAPAAAGVTSAV